MDTLGVGGSHHSFGRPRPLTFFPARWDRVLARLRTRETSRALVTILHSSTEPGAHASAYERFSPGGARAWVPSRRASGNPLHSPAARSSASPLGRSSVDLALDLPE